MGTKYSSVSVSGYNSSPPADDGSTAASNQVKWSIIKTKLPDPLKTAIESINSGLVTALDQSVRLVSSSDSAAATDHDKTIQIASTVTAAVTITLADAATMAAGYVVTVFNASSTVSSTIGRATASNTINGATSDWTLPPLSSITFLVASPATGYITKSTSLVRDAAGIVYVGSGVINGARSPNVANSGTLNLYPGSARFAGFVVVSSVDSSSANNRTQTTYSAFILDNDATSIQQIATANGSGAASTFTLTWDNTNGFVVTNTSGGTRSLHIAIFGMPQY